MMMMVAGAGRMGAATPATNDPWCALSNVLASARPARPQAASTLRMAERLAQLIARTDPGLNPFMNDRLAENLKKTLASIPRLEDQVNLRVQLGKQLLQAGRTEEGLKEIQNLESAIAAAGGSKDPRLRPDLRILKAIGLLRQGEVENCLTNHNAQSCLFPLQPAAYHQLPRGSRGAAVLLAEQVKEFPNDLSARWLLNLAHMTLGEYPDKVPSSLLIPPAAFASEYEMPRFPDVAGALGLDVDDLAGGCILDDFDNDGFIDLVSSSYRMDGQLRFFHNDGNGRFTDRTREAGLLGLIHGLNIQQTDYNNDGWLDIWVMRGAWMEKAGRLPNSLLRNNGDGTFTDVTEEAGLLSFYPTQTSTWFDYDGDGWLDLFIGNESPSQPQSSRDFHPSELYHNNGNGTFTECAAASGLGLRRFVKGVTSADYDHDGRPDLYISCREKGMNMLFHNDGPDGGSTNGSRWRFTDVTRKAGLYDANLITFPTWFFDYDNDGWEDLFVSGYGPCDVGDVAADYLGLPHAGTLLSLFRNNHNGTFSNVTVAARLNRFVLTMGCNFGDLDNDGWLDMYLGTGNPDFAMLAPNRMFRNAGGKFFQDVTTATGTGHLQKGHAIAFVDLDNDGDQDIFADMGGAYVGDNYRDAFFLNPGAGGTNRWIKLRLEGTRSNRAAIGTVIKVTVATPSGSRDIYKTVNSGGSFGSNPLKQEIGLGNATAITAVELFWPASGLRQRLSGLELNRAYRLREGDPAPLVLELKKIEFDLKASPAHPHLRVSGL